MLKTKYHKQYNMYEIEVHEWFYIKQIKIEGQILFVPWLFTTLNYIIVVNKWEQQDFGQKWTFALITLFLSVKFIYKFDNYFCSFFKGIYVSRKFIMDAETDKKEGTCMKHVALKNQKIDHGFLFSTCIHLIYNLIMAYKLSIKNTNL